MCFKISLKSFLSSWWYVVKGEWNMMASTQEMEGVSKSTWLLHGLLSDMWRSNDKLKVHTIKAILKITHREITKKSIKKMKWNIWKYLTQEGRKEGEQRKDMTNKTRLRQSKTQISE